MVKDVAPDLSSAIGPIARRLRAGSRITLREVEERSGYSRTYISDIEHGHKNPTLECVDRLLVAYGVTREDFLEFLRDQWECGETDTTLTADQKLERIRAIVER